MANTNIQLKKSGATGNVPPSLAFGELALNYADGRLYYKNASGTITYIQSETSANSFATINSNSSLILATSAADTLSFVAGNNISISTDTINKKITISSTATSNGGGGGTTTVYANAVSFVISDDVYVGDGSTTSFSLTSTPTNVYCVLVNINGVLQLTSSYTLANNVLTLSEAPASGASIEIKTTQGVTTGDVNNAISLAQAAFNQANTASANTIVTQGVDLTQNTNITTANNAAWAAFAAGNTNATNITAVNQYAAAAYAQANVTIGVDVTQNTRLQSIETINTNQNTTISIIQSVDLTQNTRLDVIEGVNLTQNTNITTANNAAWAAYAAGNTNATNITAVNNYAASGYAQANTANTRAYSTVLKSGDTMTGRLVITDTTVATSNVTGAITISGGAGIAGNLYANAVYTNGLFYANGTPYSTGGASVTLSDSVSSNSSTTAATSNAVLIAVSTALAYSIALG